MIIQYSQFEQNIVYEIISIYSSLSRRVFQAWEKC